MLDRGLGMHRNTAVTARRDGDRESDELADFRADQIRLLASRTEFDKSLDRIGAELADFLHAGGQLFAILVPIEHRVSVLDNERAIAIEHRRWAA
jgi:hypothetical protein